MAYERRPATLRYTWWTRVFILAAAALFVWGAVAEFSRGSLLAKAVWSILWVMGALGVAETLAGKNKLKPDSLVVTGPLKRRVYPRKGTVGPKRVWKVG